MNKPFTIENVREIVDQYENEKIGFPTIVDMLNKIAGENYKQLIAEMDLIIAANEILYSKLNRVTSIIDHNIPQEK